MLKPNKPQLGVERCSWVGPESEDGHFHSYHQSLLKNMDKVNTEYKQQFIINYSDSEESGESEDEEEEYYDKEEDKCYCCVDNTYTVKLFIYIFDYLCYF